MKRLGGRGMRGSDEVGSARHVSLAPTTWRPLQLARASRFSVSNRRASESVQSSMPSPRLYVTIHTTRAFPALANHLRQPDSPSSIPVSQLKDSYLLASPSWLLAYATRISSPSETSRRRRISQCPVVGQRFSMSLHR